MYNKGFKIKIKGFFMAGYLELTTADYAATVSSGVALVDFWAPWCGPCRMLAPVIDQLAEEYAGKAKICKVDTDAQSDLAVQHGIRSVPTLLFYKDGIVVATLIGAQSKAAISAQLNKLL